MTYKYIITKFKYNNSEKLFEFLLDEKNHPIEIFASLSDSQNPGDVYIARVEKINESSIFVNTGKGDVFLGDDKHIIYTKKNSLKEALHPGDEILIQIRTAALKTKLPYASSKIEFLSLHFVLKTGEKGLHFSSKLSDEFKDKLKPELISLLDDGFSLIVRSNAKEISSKEAILEVSELIRKKDDLLNKARHMSLFSCLMKARPHYLERLLHVNEEITEIITDDEEIYSELNNYKDDLKAKISYYNDSYPLSKLYSFTSLLDRAVNEYVYMRSGSNLCIQTTEALTVIDVNTAEKKQKGDREEFFLETNIEAAIESARQIRLRNLSGIIIIDFINLDKEKDVKKLISVLKTELKKDSLKSVFNDVTALGLFEISREKKYPPLKELLTRQ
jgi:ribonuclease G